MLKQTLMTLVGALVLVTAHAAEPSPAPGQEGQAPPVVQGSQAAPADKPLGGEARGQPGAKSDTASPGKAQETVGQEQPGAAAGAASADGKRQPGQPGRRGGPRGAQQEGDGRYANPHANAGGATGAGEQAKAGTSGNAGATGKARPNAGLSPEERRKKRQGGHANTDRSTNPHARPKSN